MDFVAWCDLVLCKVIEAGRRALTHRSIGVQERDVARILFSQEVVDQPEFYQSPQHIAMKSALSQLQQMDLVERSPFWKVTKTGRDVATDALPLWYAICQEKLDEEQQQLLKELNRLSPHATEGYAWLEKVTPETLLSELSWAEDLDLLRSVAQELDQWGYITGRLSQGGTMHLYATYRGLVWETRRSLTIESKFIDDLVKDWETTSVEFKSDVFTDTGGQIAEFIKDILSLATTKASGRRWLIIGFDDHTHAYYGSPNPKLTRDHIEQLLQEYTTPMVQVRYQVVDFREGPVGKLEVFRDAKHLPYKVRKSLGSQSDKRRITVGDIYVRHGSQVSKPDREEEQDLQEEGEQARWNL